MESLPDKRAWLLIMGKLCCRCGCAMTPDPAHPPGQRYCAACAPGWHRVLLDFQSRDGWHVHFIESDCRTTIGRRTRFFTLRTEAGLRAFVGRCNADADTLADFEQCLRSRGRGSLYVNLTDAQYRKLL